MKVTELIQILNYIKMSHRPEDVFEYYNTYVSISLEKIESSLAKQLPGDVKDRFREKAKLLFTKYFQHQVTYPPEMRYIVPYALGSRIPLISWKQDIGESKMRALRVAAQRCGRVISCGFRLCRRIVMIDIDFERLDPKRWVKAYSVAIRHKLPVKVTWHMGLHIYIPASDVAFPDGLLLRVVKKEGREVLLGDRLAQCAIVSRDGNIKVEVMIDAVTHHPLQSWLWIELDDARGREPPSNVTLVSCSLPLVQFRDGRRDTYPYSAKWFIWGESLARTDVPDLFRQVLSELCEALDLELKDAEKVEVIPATRELVEKAETATREGKFRVGVLEGLPPLLNLPYAPERIHLLRSRTSFNELMYFVKELDRHGRLPMCLKFFLLNPDMEYVNKHYIFIVAWFLLQHIKEWELEEISQFLAPHVAELHDLVPRTYYYVYYSAAVEEGGKYRFLRPLWGVRQLAEAHRYMCSSEPMCRLCYYRDICCRASGSASRKLMDVVDMIAVEVYLDEELRHLLVMFDPFVVDRLVRNRVPALPRAPLERRITLTKLVQEEARREAEGERT